MRRPILAAGGLAVIATAALTAGALSQVPPIQPPPGMASDGSNAAAAPARGNLAAGGALLLHQNSGGDLGSWGPTGPVPATLLRSNANLPLSADMIYWIDRDASLLVNLTCASPANGDSVGVDWIVSGTTYSPRYTVQPGDTAQSCALGIGNAINNHAGLKAALAAYHIANSGSFQGDGIGYQPYQTAVASQTSGGVTTFDQPYGTSLSAVSGGGGTAVSLAGSALAGATPALDGGPTLVMLRQVPGYTPRTGDLGPQIVFQGPVTSANNNAQLGYLGTQMLSPGAASLGMFNNSGDQLSLMNGYALLKNGAQSVYYLAITGSGGTALFGTVGANGFVQHGTSSEFQVQKSGGTLGTIDAATYKQSGVVLAGAGTMAQRQATPANPAGTTDGTGKMMGLGAAASPCTITPTTSGRVQLRIEGDLNYNVQGQTATVIGRYGTGTAPGNAAALTGTIFGNSNGHGYTAGQSYEVVPFSVTGIVTGLALNTAVWFDVSLKSGNGSSTAAVYNITCNAVEI